MGRKKKTLHDCAAEFTDLVVKQPLTEHSDSGDMSVVETLSCRACELPMRVPRDRILEHLSSGRHCRNRRLMRSTACGRPFSCKCQCQRWYFRRHPSGLPAILGFSALQKFPKYVDRPPDDTTFTGSASGLPTWGVTL